MLRKHFFKKILSTILVISLIISFISLTLTTTQVSSTMTMKEYEGPKEVFKVVDKGKPPGTPGNGPPGNPDELRAAMDKLWLKPNLATNMGIKACQRYEELFTADNMVKEYSELYHGIFD